MDWDTRYRQGQHENEPPHPLIVRFVSLLAPGRALDVACGTGRHAIWLAERGWNVMAVDSKVAIDILVQRASEKHLRVDAMIADLERHEFVIEREAYDLILVCNYLQQDLFPEIRAGVRAEGVVIAVIAMVDDDPGIKPMNPAFLLNPGELASQFAGWQLIHSFEGKPKGARSRRAVAEIVCRRRLKDV